MPAFGRHCRLQRLNLLLASNLGFGELEAIFVFGLRRGERPNTKMQTFQFQKLDSYQVAKRVCARVHALKIGQRELRDQAERAALSSFLNLSEGLVAQSRSAVRKRHLAIAIGSLGEVSAALHMAQTLGLMRDDAELESLVARLGAMLTAMLR